MRTRLPSSTSLTSSKNEIVNHSAVGMVETALIIVPHPDDEINLAGGVLGLLHDSGVRTTVLICTNGDYMGERAAQRISEARKTQGLFGYDELIFLGYGDTYVGTHVYDMRDNAVATSHAGHRETYVAGDEREYCLDRTGRHHAYTRENYKNDMRDVVLEKRADLIICIDLDRHPDHRCVSLLFDECMGEILKWNQSYRPIILKGFAYNGVWFGPHDFFDTPVKPTSVLLEEGRTIEEECFPYDWKQRIRVKSDDRTQSLKLWRNPVFKALWYQNTQNDYSRLGYCALNRFPKVANPDCCYWYRNTCNLALSARVEVSSGDAVYLNDFMLAVPENSLSDDLCHHSRGWTPDAEDKLPTVSLLFQRPVRLSHIVIYQNSDSALEVVTVKTDNGDETRCQCTHGNVVTIGLPAQGEGTTLPATTTRLTLRMDSYDNLVINEIECYEQDSGFPWDKVPFCMYDGRPATRNRLFAFLAERCFKALVGMANRFSKRNF